MHYCSIHSLLLVLVLISMIVIVIMMIIIMMILIINFIIIYYIGSLTDPTKDALCYALLVLGSVKIAGKSRFDSFGSELFEILSVRFGSVRFGQSNLPVRRGSACAFRTRRGSVWFGSVRFHVRFRPVPELNGSDRFGSAGSVRFLVPSCKKWEEVRSQEELSEEMTKTKHINRHTNK